jgi:predicted transcriptional regulator
LKFTGFPSIETIRRHSQQALRKSEVGAAKTPSVTTPDLEGVHALRCTGHCRVAGRKIWDQYSFFVAGSAIPREGRLIQQCIFVDASRLAALKDDIHRLSDGLHNGFISALWPSAEWYHSGIMLGMGMTLRTSEKQTEALRRQALAEGRSMQAVALSAIDEYIERRAHQTEVNAVLDKVIERERGVLRRLADT